ncbi:MAG TPA: SDR family NAD(P)-dependent oxidoreductase [Acetobacteraceae bacterium]|nr:SDR family NAD(P)-dependent oxidoreductase [Acetobacteraceae bacterium]
MDHLLLFGLGYTGRAIAAAAASAGRRVTIASRQVEAARPAESAIPAAPQIVAFDDAADVIAVATHLVLTAPPGETGDPVLLRHGAAIAAAPALRWIGYLSSTGVYGDRAGGLVDETSEPRPGSSRALRRVAAEAAWREIAAGRALDIFRLAGIYGPGRSALDRIRAGDAQRIVRPGHRFGRIHRDDIAAAVLAALGQNPPPGVRVFNLVDDTPAESAEVLEEAARLLGVPPPVAIDFAEAVTAMSPMARSFWADNRTVSAAATRAALGIAWRYPSYREGLRAILAEETGETAP